MPYKCPIIAKQKKAEYYEKNKEKIMAWQKTYRVINADILSEKTKKWQRENPEKYKEKTKLWNSRNKDNRRSIIMKNQYGITIDNYNELLEDQNGCCAICGLHQSRLKRGLCVDHNHVSGIVRGLLCQHCNSFLGFAGDSVNLLYRAIKYLSGKDGLLTKNEDDV